MIPKIIHQSWIGSNPAPSHCSGYAKIWKELHPSWEYKLWTNKDIGSILSRAPHNAVSAFNNHAIGKTYSAAACQADILRYLIVLKYGGVYVDIDFECFKPIDDLISGKNLIVASPHSAVHWICNGFFGATPRHEVIKDTVIDLQPRARAHNGPGHLTKHFKNFISRDFLDAFEDFDERVNELNAQGGKIKLIHPKYLFAKSNDSYACHRPLASWHSSSRKGQEDSVEEWPFKGSV